MKKATKSIKTAIFRNIIDQTLYSININSIFANISNKKEILIEKTIVILPINSFIFMNLSYFFEVFKNTQRQYAAYLSYQQVQIREKSNFHYIIRTICDLALFIEIIALKILVILVVKIKDHIQINDTIVLEKLQALQFFICNKDSLKKAVYKSVSPIKSGKRKVYEKKKEQKINGLCLHPI